MKRVVPSVVLLILLFCPASPGAQAQSGATVSGVVRDLHGAPQMGASIELLSADATVVARTFTDEFGQYRLSSVTPGSYQLRATAAFLLPALRKNVRLTQGVAAMANLTMAAIFEVGEWFPTTKRQADESSDDWRWTLRSTANRPILRLDDEEGTASIASAAERSRPEETLHGNAAVAMHDGEFADGGVRQEFKLDRGDGAGGTGTLAASVGEPTLGSASPSMAILAGVERHGALGGDTRVVATAQSHPEISSAGVVRSGLAGSGMVGLQAVSIATTERMAVGEAVMIDAGTLLTAERLVQSRAQAAPFLRVVVTPETGLALMYRFASGRELQSSDEGGELQLPTDAIADAEGRPKLLKGTHQELAATRKVGDDTETVSIYQDARPVDVLQGAGSLAPSETEGLPILADASTATFRVAVGGYTARGISVAWTHQLTPALAASLKADVGSALARGEGPLLLSDLSAGVHTEVAPALSVALHGAIVHSGTSFWTQYRWQPNNTLDQVNTFNTTPDQAYLGFLLRQRLWAGHRLQGMEAVLAATNLLEEGYQPVVGPDGRTLFLTQAARTLQAGLSFSF